MYIYIVNHSPPFHPLYYQKRLQNHHWVTAQPLMPFVRRLHYQSLPQTDSCLSSSANDDCLYDSAAAAAANRRDSVAVDVAPIPLHSFAILQERTDVLVL